MEAAARIVSFEATQSAIGHAPASEPVHPTGIQLTKLSSEQEQNVRKELLARIQIQLEGTSTRRLREVLQFVAAENTERGCDYAI